MLTYMSPLFHYHISYPLFLKRLLNNSENMECNTQACGISKAILLQVRCMLPASASSSHQKKRESKSDTFFPTSISPHKMIIDHPFSSTTTCITIHQDAKMSCHVSLLRGEKYRSKWIRFNVGLVTQEITNSTYSIILL